MTLIFIPNLDPGGAVALATEATQLNVEGHVHSIDGKITACNTGAIAGSVTANAGTNLNTSALAVESGGNLAALLTKTSGALVPFNYDNIAVNLAGATADVYTYKVAAATVATVTINYATAAKAVITTIVRT